MSTPEHPHSAAPDEFEEHDASLSARWKQARDPRGPSPATEAAIRSLAAKVRPRRAGAPKLALALAASLLLGIGLSLQPPATPPAPGAAPSSPINQTEALAKTAPPMRFADTPPSPIAAAQQPRVYGDIAAKAESDATPGVAAPSAAAGAAAAPAQSRATVAAEREQAAFAATGEQSPRPLWAVKLISLLRQHAQPDTLPDALRAIGWRVDCVDNSPNRLPCHAKLSDPSARSAPTLSWHDANHLGLDSLTPADRESLVHLLEHDLTASDDDDDDDVPVCTLHLQIAERPQQLQLQRRCVDHAARR